MAGGTLGAIRCRAVTVALHVALENLADARGLEGVLAAQREVKHASQRINVRAGVGRFAGQLLGGDGVGRAEQFAGLAAFGFLVAGPGEAEIEDFRGERAVPVQLEHDIARLDVQVQQPGGVRRGQAAAHLIGQFQKGRHVQRLADDEVLQGAPLDVFHDHERPFLVRGEIEDGDDVRVVERRQNARFPANRGVHPGGLADALDGHVAAQVLIPGAENLPHAAVADGLLHDVARLAGRRVRRRARGLLRVVWHALSLPESGAHCNRKIPPAAPRRWNVLDRNGKRENAQITGRRLPTGRGRRFGVAPAVPRQQGAWPPGQTAVHQPHFLLHASFRLVR